MKAVQVYVAVCTIYKCTITSTNVTITKVINNVTIVVLGCDAGVDKQVIIRGVGSLSLRPLSMTKLILRQVS